MPASEEKLMALTYIKTRANGDEESSKLIEETVGAERLAQELAEIANVLAYTLAIAVDKDNPTANETVLEDLRTVYYE